MILEMRTGQRFQTESCGGLNIERLVVEPFRRSSSVDAMGLQRTELEIARNRAMLAIVVGKMRMPSKRANFDRLAAAVNDPGVTLATLREVTAKLKVATQAAGMPAQSRSMPLPLVSTRAAGGRTISFVASTDGLDRHGTKILPLGIDTTRFEQNPIIGFGHDLYGSWVGSPDPRNIIGKAVGLRKTQRRLEADIEFLRGDINANAEMIFQMVKAGAVNAVSIGFIPRKVETEIDAAGREIPIIAESELLEISVVPIPSNPDALASRSIPKRRPVFYQGEESLEMVF
jgi:hypothetical protein